MKKDAFGIDHEEDNVDVTCGQPQCSSSSSSRDSWSKTDSPSLQDDRVYRKSSTSEDQLSVKKSMKRKKSQVESSSSSNEEGNKDEIQSKMSLFKVKRFFDMEDVIPILSESDNEDTKLHLQVLFKSNPISEVMEIESD